MSFIEFFKTGNNRNSDQKFFSILFEKYHQKVYRTIFFITRDRELSEDLTQETFLQVMTNIDSLRDAGHFEAWLSAIAVNKAREGLRKQSREKINILPINRSIEDVSNGRGLPEKLFEEKEMMTMVAEIVKSLDDIHKEVIILRYYWGLTEKEMANLLNVHQGTIKSRLNRARDKVQSSLRPYLVDSKDMEVKNSEKSNVGSGGVNSRQPSL